jgi:hypothetical protein
VPVEIVVEPVEDGMPAQVVLVLGNSHHIGHTVDLVVGFGTHAAVVVDVTGGGDIEPDLDLGLGPDPDPDSGNTVLQNTAIELMDDLTQIA